MEGTHLAEPPVQDEPGLRQLLAPRPTSVTTYFAYGSNMDAAQMRERCPAVVAKGICHLFGYRFIINRRGVATVVRDETADVLGLLWLVTPDDEAVLDRYEGVRKGHYSRAFLSITPEG